MGLNRNIQGGDGLIRHNKTGVHRQGPGNSNPLPLTTAKLVGKAFPVHPGQAYLFQQFVNPLGELPAFHPLDLQGQTNDLFHRLPGIQRGEGVLENNLHPPPELQKLITAEVVDLFAVKIDLPSRGFIKPKNSPAQSGFPATAFPDKAHGFTFIDGKRDPVDGVDIFLFPCPLLPESLLAEEVFF